MNRTTLLLLAALAPMLMGSSCAEWCEDELAAAHPEYGPVIECAKDPACNTVQHCVAAMEYDPTFVVDTITCYRDESCRVVFHYDD